MEHHFVPMSSPLLALPFRQAFLSETCKLG